MFDTDLDDVLEVVAGGLHDGVEDEPGVVGEDDGQHRDQAEGEGDLGEDLDAVCQAGEHGKRGDDGNEADDGHKGLFFPIEGSQMLERAGGDRARRLHAVVGAVARDVPGAAGLLAVGLRRAADVLDKL